MRWKPGFAFSIFVLVLGLSACQRSESLPVPVLLTATTPVSVQSTARLGGETAASSSNANQPIIASLQPELSASATPQPGKVVGPGLTEALQVKVCSPLEGVVLDELPAIISSPYDPPPGGKEERHHGVDFSYYRRGEQASIQGTGVQAILPGVVTMALTDSFPYGNVVIIETDLSDLPAGFLERLDPVQGDSLYTLFAHLDTAPRVQLGQTVSACQRLGAVGKSGNAGVAHLHLETRLGPAGNSFEIMGYYLAESTEQEKDNYLRWRISGEFRHFDPMDLLNWRTLP